MPWLPALGWSLLTDGWCTRGCPEVSGQGTYCPRKLAPETLLCWVLQQTGWRGPLS